MKRPLLTLLRTALGVGLLIYVLARSGTSATPLLAAWPWIALFASFMFVTASIEAVRLKILLAAQSLRLPLTVIRDTYAGERQAYESRFVLVRPDQYVVWAGDEPPGDAVGLLQQVAGIA